MNKSELVAFVVRFSMEACRRMGNNHAPETPGWSDSDRVANDALALLRLASQ